MLPMPLHKHHTNHVSGALPIMDLIWVPENGDEPETALLQSSRQSRYAEGQKSPTLNALLLCHPVT
jgi:hypothetical protein